jgi:hypothetical protein
MPPAFLALKQGNTLQTIIVGGECPSSIIPRRDDAIQSVGDFNVWLPTNYNPSKPNVNISCVTFFF